MTRKTFRTIILCFVAVFCIGFYILVPSVNTASAYNAKTDGSQKSARLKEWYHPFADCLDHSGDWNYVGGQSRILDPEKIRNGDWWSGSSWYTPKVNPFVEAKVQSSGKYGDGKVNCGENNNALLNKTLSELNNFNKSVSVDKEDIICYYNNHDETGALTIKSNLSCDLVYNGTLSVNDGIFFTNNKKEGEKSSSIYDMVYEKLFEGSIPNNDMFSLTTLEKYYVVYDAFTTACVNLPAGGRGGSLDKFKEKGNYIIQEYDNDSKALISVGYYGKNNPGPGTRVNYFINDSATCQDMADFLNGNNNSIGNGSESLAALKDYMTYLAESGIDPSEEEDDSAGGGQIEKNCQNQGGAGSLGWIVCSILDWMQRTTDTLYEGVVEPALVVNKSFFEGDTVYSAWTTFRDISNIIFIILLLMVIFSQVTGVGIDNYGIKKILPKLIIAAVLVNLSYWVCLICVDISNILGAGFQDFFNGIPVTADPVDSVTIAVEDGSVAINGILSKGLVAVTVVGAAATAIAVVANPALLLTLFVSVLGVLIAVLFMFILLAGRKAAIILLIIFSPVAFVLYLLPNTKKLFDKWLKLWQAMLFLYPIAGLLIGGGNFASRIMLNIPGGGATTIFTAMIVGIIPIFFIPTVLKGAFSAMGSIGGAIAGAGNRLRSGATGRMKNSDLYKNAQQMGLDRKNRVKSGLNKNGDLTKLGRLRHKAYNSPVGRFFGADRRLNARTKAARKTMSDQEEASATSMELLSAAEMRNTDWVKAADGSGNLFSGRRENYYASKFTKAAEKGDRKSMNAALSAAKAAGVKDKDVAKMVRNAVNSGKLSGKNDAQMSLWLQSQASTNKALAKDVELQDWAAKGGTEALGGYGEYAENNMKPSDLDKGKISNASTESLAGLAKAKVLQTNTAREVLEDNSMQLSPDKRIILGAVKDNQIVSNGATVEGIVKDAEALSAGDPIASGGTGINSGVTATYANENWVAPPPKRVEIKTSPTPPTPPTP